MKQRQAFSFIEISIILIVISLLIAGAVSYRGNLFNSSKLNKIKNFTKNSPLKDLEHLAIWLDTATKKSFRNSEMTNGGYLSVWKNIAPNNYDKINFSQSNSSYQPKYIFDNKDGLPTISFDGNDYLFIDNIFGHQFTKYNQFTLFIVQKYNSPNHDSKTIYWESTGANKFTMKLINSSGDAVTHFANNTMSSAVESSFKNSWNIITFSMNSDDNLSIRINGSLIDSSTESDDFDVTATSDFKIGSGLNGEIREIAVIKNKISDQAIEEVEKYLSKKWNIDL